MGGDVDVWLYVLNFLFFVSSIFFLFVDLFSSFFNSELSTVV